MKSLLPGVVLASRHGGWDSGVESPTGQQTMKTPSLVVSGVLLTEFGSVTAT